MRQRSIIIGTILIVVLAGAYLFYLFYPGGSGGQALATVNGQRITVDHFNQKITKVKEPNRGIFKEHSGKAEILVIDVYKYQNLAREHKIQIIPTLVFFDSNGKELYRHKGFMSKKAIVAQLREMGVS